MKKLVSLLIALCCLTIAKAETDLESRIGALEAQLTTLQTAVNGLNAQVVEVTKQNLALKQALHLQPTIAKCVTENGVDIRLISAEGDIQTGTVSLTLSIVNTTKRVVDIQYSQMKAYDENGEQFIFEYKAKIADDSAFSITKLYPDTPLTMRVELVAKGEPAYIKVIDAVEYKKNAAFRFTNIPIKWK